MSLSLDNLLEMQILWPYARSTESETLEIGPGICVLSSPPANSDACSCLRTTGRRYCQGKEGVCCHYIFTNLDQEITFPSQASVINAVLEQVHEHW